jgi:hypothetical protein
MQRGETPFKNYICAVNEFSILKTLTQATLILIQRTAYFAQAIN